MPLLAELGSIKSGLTRLIRSDPVFATLDRSRLGAFTREQKDGDFPSMVGAILGQQVSMAAARSMWQKLLNVSRGKVTPQRFMTLTDEQLRGCGFSRQKILYARGLGAAILEKDFIPARLVDLSDDEAIAAITRLKGFGVWSAQMYLIFSLGRPDVWPDGDLGIQIGAQYYLRKRTRPDKGAMEKLGTRFSGHRTAAALLLWDLKAIREAEKKNSRAPKVVEKR